MAVPKRRTSKGKRNQRRSHHALKMANIAFDSVTGEAKLSHHVSLKDGYYNSRLMVKKLQHVAKVDQDPSEAE